MAVTAISLASFTRPRTPLISLTLLIFSGTVSAASKSLLEKKEKKQDYNIYIVYRLYFLLNLTCKTLTKLPEIEHRFLDPLKVCKTHFNFLIFIS